MKEYTVNSFSDLHDLFENSEKDIIYRGQSDSNWELIPKAGRKPYDEINDKTALDYFKNNSIPFLDIIPENDWDWLALAQHNGIPTRLLDWTLNPLIATFFAVVKDEDLDASVYKFKPKDLADQSKKPFDLKTVTFFKPKAITKRIIAQQGSFTVHPKPFSNSFVKGGTLEKIVIGRKYRKKLKFELHRYGFSYFSVFQDLQGLSKYIEWRWLNREFKKH